MLRFIPVLALLLFTACGLAENEQDDKNKRIYITFTDPAFEQFCLGMFDLDHDGRISRYEAQRVLVMDCSGRNISAMWEIGEFSRLPASFPAASPRRFPSPVRVRFLPFPALSFAFRSGFAARLFLIHC